MCRSHVLCVLMLLAFSASARGYEFTSDSCASLLPIFHHHHHHHKKSDSGTVVQDSGKPGKKNDLKDEYDYQYDDSSDVSVLTAATETSPFRILPSMPKYRRNRELTVLIDGPELNGIIIQARQYISDAHVPVLIGGFITIPSNLAYLGCVHGVKNTNATDIPINTAYSKDKKSKKNLKVKWLAPFEDVGSLQFVATIVQGNQYWNNIKSAPLLFNIFPPDLSACGEDRSCYRVGPGECTADTCDVVVVTKIDDTDVIFIIGGRVEEESGYVAVGFTADPVKMDHIDLCVCKKRGYSVDAAHYMVSSLDEAPQRHHEEMTDEETDVYGDYIWCKFRRPLTIPFTHAADLTKNVTQIVMSGKLTDDQDPILPEELLIYKHSESWNYTATTNVIHSTNTGHRASQWTSILLSSIVVLILMTTQLS